MFYEKDRICKPDIIGSGVSIFRVVRRMRAAFAES
jgi:hypothetical protein